ncbi:MAG: hypothetical protein HZA61_00500 [Candidatus Eisenbacteria bacterium]|uniref:Tetratricopeptide repeat protein n=1 Tax=Eiseniibacteriota bacterium TaxID=2212470 RepID=A0A933SA12_UNCEI|nr:hypothetical protein [Candidatus Eisenbacteria bacterium]
MLRRFLIALPLLVVIACAVTTTARAASPAELVAAQRQLDEAVTKGEPKEILRTRAVFAAMLAAEPDSPVLNYWIALCGWRALPMLTETDKEAAKKLCKESIAACDRVLAAKPKHADAIALKAALQALSLAFNPAASMSLGPEMIEAYGKAEALEPENPRVQLLKGINTLHMPAFVGGGPDKAKPVFERAIALADADAARGAGPDAWGRADAHLWAGICASRANDWKTAAARFREALAIAPGHAWLSKRLLPDAEKHLAEGGAR